MLEVRNITLAHGTTTILLDVSLGIAQGELVALCGPNGAGKSTLLAAMSGEMPARSGSISINDTDIAGMSALELAQCRSVLEQTPTLSAAFDVETLTALSIPRAVPPRNVDAITRDVLLELDLTSFAKRPVHQLSGGQRHRAHLARSLAQLQGGRHIGGGNYLMLDEPTASLDITHQIAVMQAARRAAAAQSGVIVVLHDLNLAAAFADRIILLHDGGIVADGPPRDVLTPTRLSKVYQTEIRVTQGDDAPTVTPVYANKRPSQCISP